MFSTTRFRNYPPVILGHEFSGTVVEVGRKVTNATVGERVAGLGATAVTCGQCEYCRSGYFIFCASRRGMGHGVNGAFTRYVVMRPDQLYRFPEIFRWMSSDERTLCGCGASGHRNCQGTRWRNGPGLGAGSNGIALFSSCC